MTSSIISLPAFFSFSFQGEASNPHSLSPSITASSSQLSKQRRNRTRSAQKQRRNTTLRRSTSVLRRHVRRGHGSISTTAHITTRNTASSCRGAVIRGRWHGRSSRVAINHTTRIRLRRISRRISIRSRARGSHSHGSTAVEHSIDRADLDVAAAGGLRDWGAGGWDEGSQISDVVTDGFARAALEGLHGREGGCEHGAVGAVGRGVHQAAEEGAVDAMFGGDAGEEEVGCWRLTVVAEAWKMTSSVGMQG